MHSDLVLSDLGSEIASAIKEHSQNLEALLVTSVQAERSKLSTTAVGMSSTFIDVSAENDIGGSVAVFGQAENLNVHYVDNRLKVSMVKSKPGWQTFNVAAVNEALQVATGSCRIFVEKATGALLFDKAAIAEKPSSEKPSSEKRARQDSWAKEAYEKGLKGEEAKAFFEAKLLEHKGQATPKSE